MNQILSTQMSEDRNYNTTNRNSGNNNKKGIIVFFVCTLIIIGIVIAILGFIKLQSNKKKEEEQNETAKVTIEEVEDGQIKLNASYRLGINRLEYYFNDDGDITNIQINGKTEIEKLVDKPANAYKLTVKVTDTNGRRKRICTKF